MISCDFCKVNAKYKYELKHGVVVNMCEDHAEKAAYKDRLVLIEAPVVQTAVCNCCFETKPITEFYTYTDTRGVKRQRLECKQCNLEMRKKIRLRKK